MISSITSSQNSKKAASNVEENKNAKAEETIEAMFGARFGWEDAEMHHGYASFEEYQAHRNDPEESPAKKLPAEDWYIFYPKEKAQDEEAEAQDEEAEAPKEAPANS